MQSNVISSSDIDRGLVDGIILVYKDRGETPLEVLNKLKARFSTLTNVPLSYAGRLDPLASGLILVLSGNFNKRRGEFLGLDKTYIVEFLLGVSTDTGDLMGMIDKVDEVTGAQNSEMIDEENIKKVLKSLKGKYDMPYPMFSSKTVDGKQLHQWAREGAKDGVLAELEIPMQKADIKDIEYLGIRMISSREVAGTAIELVSGVSGDFRQKEIIHQWSEFKEKNISDEDKINSAANFLIVKVKVDVGSGTYMRTLASVFAEKLGTCGLAYSIHREKVADVGVDQAIIIV
jgi:tRNA pseudouridine(55) synthase